ncbi:cobalamin-binding protein [Sphingomonas sp. ID1715]|uniref:cobalamin-binding protein n=1 Tax=Sphingomonas sp. ID1715 TaxID=1656898 RepID=UPI00148A0763|nr:cobalamin-binding protein [Sphingomonas sp. ID1715]NNM78705.1 cobalamin-binding protein [Sphingomonas sp. ID1715]
MAATPRIVSLLPSATEIAVALGLGEVLVGRSHECDWPPEVAQLPALTATKIPKGMRSIKIDYTVKSIIESGLSAYTVDAERLRALRPDVILTQTQCAVCAVTPRDLEEALADWTGTRPLLLSLAPDTLADVWGDFARVAEATGRDAAPVVAALQARLAAIPQLAERPGVAAVEWIEPLMIAGNWIPELVEIAGGEPLLASAGQHSDFIKWEEVRAADPEVIVAMPCGFQVSRTLEEMPLLDALPGWSDIRAVRDGRVFVADGHHLYNRPGPRLVESAEALHAMIHGGDAHAGRYWTRYSASAARTGASHSGAQISRSGSSVSRAL